MGRPEREAMDNLLLAAKILYAHAYNGISWDAGRDLTDDELPGWLADCKSDIEAGPPRPLRGREMTSTRNATTPDSCGIMIGQTEKPVMSTLKITLAANGGFEVEIPSDLTEGSHHVQIPFTLTGLSILRKLLQERARKEKQTIGMNGSPTRQMVEAWLREEKMLTEEEIAKAKRAKEEKAIANAKSNPLLINLNIEELDL